MRAVIFGAMLIAAGFMAYLFFRGECPGGQVFASEAQCRAAAGFDAAFCRISFAQARRRAYEDASPFSTQDACLRHFPVCEPHHKVVSGYVPVPRGVCVTSGKPGEPVFEKIGHSLQKR